jgi:uncharacterized membrane protein HdeD (DUF308 family)
VFKSASTALVLRGVLAIALGVVAIAWPGVTVLVLAAVFAAFAFAEAALQGVRALGDGEAGPLAGHLLLSVAGTAAGVVALAWPVPTALVLVLTAAIWAIAAGVLEFALACAPGLPAGTRALGILAGLLLVAFGGVVISRPGLGPATFALLFGLFALIFGTTQVIAGVQGRSRPRALDVVGPRAHAA